jgi:hypothetical protein
MEGVNSFGRTTADAHGDVKLTQMEGDWYWYLDVMNDDNLIGPFASRDEAIKDARETLGITEGED